MNKRRKINADGISSYYKNLPFGEKDKFVTRIAEALEMSTPNVRRKIYRGSWKGYELKFVEDIINS